MRAIRWILCALLAVTAVLYTVTGVMEHISRTDEGPVIECGEEIIQVSIHASEAELLASMTASDAQDGDLTDRIIVGDVSKLVGTDLAKVTCLVFDSDDNMASLTRQVRYTDYRRPVFQLTQPLEFASTREAKLLDRVRVTDSVDGDISAKARVSTLWPTDNDQVYSATVTVTNSMGDIADVEVPVIIRSAPSPIRLSRQIIYVSVGESFDPMDYVISGRSGLTARCEGTTEEPGCWWVWYENSNDFAIATVVVE
ncbi:MAG: hypothetical protein II290_04860 [Oscillospiraceae bacterium]|nr:hypothetical protein [Oscillospiraceae bacterium]